MSKALFIRAISGFAAGLLLVSVLLFIPAGTWNYPQGWLLMGILFVPMFLAGLVMMKKKPELLKKRLNGKTDGIQEEAADVLYFSGTDRFFMVFRDAFVKDLLLRIKKRRERLI